MQQSKIHSFAQETNSEQFHFLFWEASNNDHVKNTWGCGISAKPPTEAIETGGKSCEKTPFSAGLLSYIDFLWWHGYKIKPHQRRWLFPSAFTLLSLISAATQSASQFHREMSACSPEHAAAPWSLGGCSWASLPAPPLGPSDPASFNKPFNMNYKRCVDELVCLSLRVSC